METGWSAAVFARDGRFQPYAGIPGGLQSFTWQRVRRRKKKTRITTTISQHNISIQSVYQHHTLTINQTCNMHINRNWPPGRNNPVAPCRRQCKPESTRSAKATALHLTSAFCKIPGRGLERTSSTF